MSITSDLPAMLEIDGFAMTIQHNGINYPALVDRQARTDANIAGRTILAHLMATSADNIKAGDEIVIDHAPLTAQELFEVVGDPRPHDDARMKTLLLREKLHTVTYSGWNRIIDRWIDEEYPLFPVGQPWPPGSDLRTLRVRNGEYDAHALITIMPLVAPLGPLPATTAIKRAELWVQGDESVDCPSWYAYRIKREMNPIEANWNQYRSGNAWAIPGAQSTIADYDLTECFGSGTGIDAFNMQRLLQGKYFTDRVHANRAGAFSIVVHDNGAMGELRWISGHPENLSQPELRLWYAIE
jgi:hypothetical protein